MVSIALFQPQYNVPVEILSRVSLSVPFQNQMLEELDKYGGDLGSSQPGMGGRATGAASEQPSRNP